MNFLQRILHSHARVTTGGYTSPIVATVSRHLAILLRAGLVRKERMCRDVYYYVDGKKLAEVSRVLNQLGARK